MCKGGQHESLVPSARQAVGRRKGRRGGQHQGWGAAGWEWATEQGEQASAWPEDPTVPRLECTLSKQIRVTD